MQDERLIGYRPHITYEDEYTSDAGNLFNNNNTGENPEDNKDDNIIDDLIEQMEVIDSLIDKLPGNASDAVGEVFDQIIDFVEEELKDKTYDKVPEVWEWTYEPEVPDGGPPEVTDPDGGGNPGDEGDFDEDGFWDDVDEFPIVKEEHTKHEVIEKEYVKNLTDLFDDYFVNLHTIIANYWTNLIPAIYNKSANEINMIVENILLSSSNIIPNAKHLLDSAIRGQIIRTMGIDYFSNIFNAEETITHLKQFKAMYELRIRYADIEAQQGTNKTNQMSNNILEGMQLTYDRKYDIAYENLYRYLKSSNEVLDDTLRTWITEIKSKHILLERKGIK